MYLPEWIVSILEFFLLVLIVLLALLYSMHRSNIREEEKKKQEEKKLIKPILGNKMNKEEYDKVFEKYWEEQKMKKEIDIYQRKIEQLQRNIEEIKKKNNL